MCYTQNEKPTNMVWENKIIFEINCMKTKNFS